MLKQTQISERFKLLVFDWDGTLADSLYQIISAMNKAICSLELEPRTHAAIRDIIGLGLAEGIICLYPSLDNIQRQHLADKYRHYYLDSIGKTKLYPGSEDVIKTLHTSGYYMAIATGKSRRGLNRALQESGLMDYFHTSCCADEGFSKPHPQMLQEIMMTLEMKPEQTLMIGDSMHDLQMATNATVASAAVKYGANDVRRLLEFNPLVCFESLGELPEWLLKN